jgi:hypothetical protein
MAGPVEEKPKVDVLGLVSLAFSMLGVAGCCLLGYAREFLNESDSIHTSALVLGFLVAFFTGVVIRGISYLKPQKGAQSLPKAALIGIGISAIVVLLGGILILYWRSLP